MNETQRVRICLMMALMALVLLIVLTVLTPPTPAVLLPGLLFCALFVFNQAFGIRVGGGSVSLLPMTSVAAYLVIGLVPAAWVAWIGALLYGGIRARWSLALEEQQVSGRPLLGLTAINAAMHTLSILAGGAIYEGWGGILPLTSSLPQIGRLFVLGLVYLSANYLLAGGYMALRGRSALRAFVRSLPQILGFEGAPLLFAPLTALIYNRLGPLQFIFFALILVAAALIARNLDRASRRLQRRVQELGSLQAVGQALSASLQIETVVSAIYTQVSRLMPAQEFYVALYNAESGEVSFPLAVEGGERVRWRSRRMGNGLTEHLLRTKAPLLIPRQISERLKELGIEQIGRSAACWLGVPILAGPEVLGIIAVQSYTTAEAYDLSHQEVLMTIAAQAAVAIQNARLYAQTDEALSRRVQELDSILRTVREGILLLDLEWRVVAVNRTLTELVGATQVELIGQVLTEALPGGQIVPIALIGYDPVALQADCTALMARLWPQKRDLTLLGPAARHIERTLAPVRDAEGAIIGWLLIFRDITQEVELARLKDEMTGMLVHDLRSPLTVVMGSVALMKRAFARQDAEQFAQLLTMAEQNGDRMLRMVNELLDISKLESDQLPLQLETVEVESLLQMTAARMTALATTAQITLTLAVEPDLPPLRADAQLIGRVLSNLLDNALKFTPDGGQVRLWASHLPDREHPTLLLGVTDTGPGIPEEARPYIFEKFRQVSTIHGRRGGTGLGLAFCKLVVEAHGGRIWVESEVGQGSTFIFALPVVSPEVTS